jgi:hypothetical protein
MLAALALGVCLSASALAAGREARSRFLVSIEGYQQTVVTNDKSTTDDLGCTTRANDVDRQMLKFTTAADSRIIVSGTRLATFRLPVQVTIAGTKHRQTTIVPRICGASPRPTDSTCVPVRVPARVVVRSASPGAVRVDGSLSRQRDRTRCATLLDTAYPFLEVADGRLNSSYLNDSSVGQINVYGDTRVVDVLPSGAEKTTTIRWTLVLKRAP